MEPRQKKVFVKDSVGEVKWWIAARQDGNGRGWKPATPTHEFEKLEDKVLTFPSYDDPSILDGPVAFAQNSTFVPPSAAGDEQLSHAPLPGCDLCLACEEVEIRSLFGRRAGRKYRLGCAEDVISCKDCALCRIVTAGIEFSLGKSGEELLRSVADCFVILTSTPSSYPLRTGKDRQYHLMGYFLHRESGALVGQCHIRLLNKDARKVGKSSLFSGRAVKPSKANFKMARYWLAECNENHECKPNEDQGRKIDGKLVIDVRQSCLVSLPKGARYLALSYVWPRFEALQLKKENLTKLKEPGSLLELGHLLPKKLQDALQVVRDLDETYIWIDALCIIQDDPDNKSELIHSMDSVYGDSYLNIVIASSTSPTQDYSIPGIGEPRKKQQVLETVEDIRLVTAFPDYNASLERSWWATRGWTFQEGVLSCRCLVFTDYQMYFRCTKDARCEDVVAETETQSDEVHPAKPKERESKVDYLINSSFLESISEQDTFGEYVRLVRDYTKRSLSYEADILPAFDGIMTKLVPHFHQEGFFCGLPFLTFDNALLWYPTSAGRRRRWAIDGKEYSLLPTWSWAGWVGSVDFEVDVLGLGDAKAQFPSLQWHRLDRTQTHDALLPVRLDVSQTQGSPPPDSPIAFALGVLWSRLAVLQQNHSRIVAWAATIRRSLKVPESFIMNWVTDWDQSLPCFAIMDADGDPCGFIPSADRGWAREYEKAGGGECELVLLSHAQQSRADQLEHRADFFHEKYNVENERYICFLNVMLIGFTAEGIAYRLGIGRIHKAAVHAEDVANIDYKVLVLA